MYVHVLYRSTIVEDDLDCNNPDERPRDGMQEDDPRVSYEKGK
jgi:hypothetical protein